VNLQKTIANAHDNAFELSLHQATHHLFIELAYTWSRSIDQSSSLAEAVYPDVTGFSSPTLNRSLSAFDLTHNLSANYHYDLPLQRLWHAHPLVTEGWQLSGLTRLSTGLPVTLVNNNDTSLLGTQPNGINNNGVDEPTFLPGNLHLNNRPGKNAFNTNLFSLPTLGTLGNARRRFFHGPGQDNTDLALSKTTRLTSNTTHFTPSGELRLEAFNLFNHSQFFGPNAVNGNISSPNFGHIQTASPPRIMQLSARINF
jgi:hypothetical protein